MNRTWIRRLSLVLGVLATAGMLFLLLILGLTENVTVFQERTFNQYTQITSYSYEEIEDEQSPSGIIREYRWNLEETPRGDTCLAFYVVHQQVEVWMDGKLVYQLKPSKESRFSKTTGSNWVMIPLYPEDGGREIRVRMLPVYQNYQNKNIEFLVGSQLQIYLQRLKKDLPQLILGIAAMLVGIVFLGIGIYNRIICGQGGSLASLGIFSVLLGLWRITDTRMTPFLFPGKPIGLFYISIGMLMMSALPFLKSVRDRFSKNCRVWIEGCCIVVEIVCLIQLILQIFHIADFRQNLTVTHVMIIGCVLVLMGCLLYDGVKNTKSVMERRISLVCVAGGMADLIAYYIKGNSSGLIFTLSAFLIYIIFTGGAMLMDYKEQQKRLKEQEEELMSSRISILLSQIQPHFLFNSLNVIRSLCRRNPSDAVEALDHFSEYLRGSMKAVKVSKCIPFETELEHVQNYLYMEQKRFGKKLQVVYDICERDFLIPPLTIQPMAENAVRHGVRQRLEGGCVTISSFREERCYVVEITDDGVGFDTETLQNMSESHVGINNVKKRLEMMCQGSMEIQSTPGEGTRVVIQIPSIMADKRIQI